MASRKEYMREWRKVNPGYNHRTKKLVQRYCKECNVEVGKGKTYCSECYITKRRADSRARYKYTPEKSEYARKWREANKDKCKEYAQISKQREWDKLGPKLCHRCNVEIERKKKYCSPCYPIVQKELKKISNDKQAGNRKRRYENRDRLAYNAYYRNYFKNRRKKTWYTSRLERIEKLKLCLEENK